MVIVSIYNYVSSKRYINTCMHLSYMHAPFIHACTFHTCMQLEFAATFHEHKKTSLVKPVHMFFVSSTGG